MYSCRYVFVLLVLSPFGLLGGLEYRLMTGDPSARVSGELTVLVVVTNSGTDTVTSELPDTVEARVGRFVVPLRRDESAAEVEVEPGVTILERYRGTLPGDLEGLVAIEITELGAGRCVAEFGHASTDHALNVAERTGPSDSDDDLPIAPRFADNLSFYEPMYFVVGPRVSLNAKFQLSFKYRLLSANSQLVEGRPFWEDFFFGYTQTSLWDLGGDSAPFLDTSYKPALFYFDLNLRFGRPDGLELAATIRKGTEAGYGSVQLDLTYPFDRIFFHNAASYLHLQYFNGWGETLLNYDERLPAQYRIGVSLFR